MSDLKGITVHKERNKPYRAKIGYGVSNPHSLGYYKLITDAAYVYDKALRLVKGPHRKANFDSEKEYLDLRAVELRQTGFDVDMEEIQSYMVSTLKDLKAKVDELEASKNVPSAQKKKFFLGEKLPSCGKAST